MTTEEERYDADRERARRKIMTKLADPAKIDPIEMTEVESRIVLALAMHRLAQSIDRHLPPTIHVDVDPIKTSSEDGL